MAEFKSSVNSDSTQTKDGKDITTKITPQDIMDKLTSLAETMVNLQTQIDGIKVNEKQVVQSESELESESEEVISSEEAWESLFK